MTAEMNTSKEGSWFYSTRHCTQTTTMYWISAAEIQNHEQVKGHQVLKEANP